MRVLEIFIDGFGLGENDAEFNPILAAKTPFLDRILEGHNLWAQGVIQTPQAVLVPLNASLGMSGIPQSATGQTTLWTGVNAAQLEGRHINAYPTIKLQKVISEQSIFKTLKARGLAVAFANAFSPVYFDLVKEGKRRHSTSTLTALAGDVPLRSLEDLLQGNAVYQDISNELLQEMDNGFPVYTPEQAGKNLAGIASEHDFTLFEFFQTDRAGHKQDRNRSIELIERIDGFLAAVAGNVDWGNTLVLLTSDHGNIEDLSVKSHTCNPVPLVLIGDYSRTPYTQITGIEDLAAFVVAVVTNC